MQSTTMHKVKYLGRPMVTRSAEHSKKLKFSLAASNTRVVGRMLAFFLNNMKTYFIGKGRRKEQLEFHLVGHSLGAHVCGQGRCHFQAFFYSEIFGDTKKLAISTN